MNSKVDEIKVVINKILNNQVELSRNVVCTGENVMMCNLSRIFLFTSSY